MILLFELLIKHIFFVFLIDKSSFNKSSQFYIFLHHRLAQLNVILFPDLRQYPKYSWSFFVNTATYLSYPNTFKSKSSINKRVKSVFFLSNLSVRRGKLRLKNCC